MFVIPKIEAFTGLWTAMSRVGIGVKNISRDLEFLESEFGVFCF
jgi:hypothetical protein